MGFILLKERRAGSGPGGGSRMASPEGRVLKRVLYPRFAQTGQALQRETQMDGLPQKVAGFPAEHTS